MAQDVSGKEQESICLLYVDNNLIIEECFIGLYQPADTTGEPLSLLLQNVLTMLDLSFDNLHGQSYDGVSNMSGATTAAKLISNGFNF